jgi:hypothetical protein
VRFRCTAIGTGRFVVLRRAMLIAVLIMAYPLHDFKFFFVYTESKGFWAVLWYNSVYLSGKRRC